MVLPIAPDDISLYTLYSHAVKFHYAAKMTCPPRRKGWRLFADSIIDRALTSVSQNAHFHSLLAHARTLRPTEAIMMCYVQMLQEFLQMTTWL